MSTVDYATHADMVAALVDAYHQGLRPDVIGNGRTLRFPDTESEPETKSKRSKKSDAEDVI